MLINSPRTGSFGNDISQKFSPGTWISSGSIGNILLCGEVGVTGGDTTKIDVVGDCGGVGCGVGGCTAAAFGTVFCGGTGGGRGLCTDGKILDSSLTDVLVFLKTWVKGRESSSDEDRRPSLNEGSGGGGVGGLTEMTSSVFATFAGLRGLPLLSALTGFTFAVFCSFLLSCIM